MPICDIWCYTLQDSHNKLEACRVLMGKVESSDVYFLAAYILSSYNLLSNHLYSVFVSMPAHHVLQQRWNVPTKVFLPIYSTYSLFLPIWASNNTSLCISIFWGETTFFEAWRFLETKENLDSFLKWTLE